MADPQTSDLEKGNKEKDIADPQIHDARDWASSGDPGNAENWPFLVKAFPTALVGAVAFLCTMASSIYTPGQEDVSNQFHLSKTVSLLPYSFYNLGLAFGSILGSPSSETFGRRTVYLFCLPMFALFTLGAGVSQGIAALIICRFFAGLFGSPGISIASATIADIWPPHRRVIPMAAYYCLPWLGSVIGPLVGGFVVSSKGWRWTQWTILFLTLPILTLTFFMRESFKSTILHHRAADLDIPGPPKPQRTALQHIRFFITTTITRLLHMLFTEPIVGLLSLYTSFSFGLVALFVTANPYVFSTIYHFDLRAQGLSFLGLATGCLFGPILLITTDKYIYAPKLLHLKATNTTGTLSPKHRLYGAMLGSPLLPVSLFAFAWLSRPSIPWIYPLISQAIFMLGSLTVYVSSTLYMIDTYGPRYAASAVGANALLRYVLAAVFPLFAVSMYEGLGVGWATNVLGFCAAVIGVLPWIFWRLGSRLKAGSAYREEKEFGDG